MKEQTKPPEELYDLVFDPQEQCNLLELKSIAPEHEQVHADLKQRLDNWMHATNDPLLADDPSALPLPDRVNTWDQDHPGSGSTAWNPSDWERLRPL